MRISRRTFVVRAGQLGAATALAPIPLIARPGAEAAAATPQHDDVVRQTISGFLAFLLPGNDPYSIAQGESAPARGALGGGALEPFMYVVDHFVPVTAHGVADTTLPGAALISEALNQYALSVNPTARRGDFAAPFARLSFREKGEVLRRFEADSLASDLVPELRFVSGIMLGAAAFVCLSEAGAYDARTRRLRFKPVGWEISGYGGPAEGHADFRGYFQGRRSASGRGVRA